MPAPRRILIAPLFALFAIACASAQLADWQMQYYSGMRALNEGRSEEARSSLKEAYDYARSHDADRAWLARTAFGLGSYAQMQSDDRASERLQTEALNILEADSTRTPLLGLVFNGLGEAMLGQSRFGEAQRMFQQAADILEPDQTLRPAAFLARRHLAETRLLQDDFRGAEQLLLPLIAEESQLPPSPGLSSALRILGRVYTMQQRWAQAESVLREAMRLETSSNIPLALADTELEMGIMYRIRGEIARAEPLLRKAMKTYEAHQDTRAMGAYRQLGLCRLAENKQASAREFFIKALDVATKASMSDIVIENVKHDLAAAGQTIAAATRERP